jgi:phthiocerol/phenolphthiocerol synthesis type-I polyketide synthase E
VSHNGAGIDDVSPEARKRGHRQFYDAITARLDASEFGNFSYFLNLGYVADDSPRFAQVRLPDRFPNRTSAELALEVIGDCPLTGRRLLDVGCGRGGTLSIVSRFFQPASLIGVDLSPRAVAFDRHTHRAPHLQFCAGDAEHLPFASGAFDVVTNIESSHTYPRIEAFYAEVSRVLAAGGSFLYADVLPHEKLASGIRRLRELGFILQRIRDITPNVLRSCDLVAGQRLTAFAGHGDPTLENFLAAPGSGVYEQMRSGACAFQILTLRKAQ